MISVANLLNLDLSGKIHGHFPSPAMNWEPPNLELRELACKCCHRSQLQWWLNSLMFVLGALSTVAGCKNSSLCITVCGATVTLGSFMWVSFLEGMFIVLSHNDSILLPHDRSFILAQRRTSGVTDSDDRLRALEEQVARIQWVELRTITNGSGVRYPNPLHNAQRVLVPLLLQPEAPVVENPTVDDQKCSGPTEYRNPAVTSPLRRLSERHSRKEACLSGMQDINGESGKDFPESMVSIPGVTTFYTSVEEEDITNS